MVNYRLDDTKLTAALHAFGRRCLPTIYARGAALKPFKMRGFERLAALSDHYPR